MPDRWSRAESLDGTSVRSPANTYLRTVARAGWRVRAGEAFSAMANCGAGASPSFTLGSADSTGMQNAIDREARQAGYKSTNRMAVNEEIPAQKITRTSREPQCALVHLI